MVATVEPRKGSHGCCWMPFERACWVPGGCTSPGDASTGSVEERGETVVRHPSEQRLFVRRPPDGGPRVPGPPKYSTRIPVLLPGVSGQPLAEPARGSPCDDGGMVRGVRETEDVESRHRPADPQTWRTHSLTAGEATASSAPSDRCGRNGADRLAPTGRQPIADPACAGGALDGTRAQHGTVVTGAGGAANRLSSGRLVELRAGVAKNARTLKLFPRELVEWRPPPAGKRRLPACSPDVTSCCNPFEALPGDVIGAATFRQRSTPSVYPTEPSLGR